jgi:hypothetical protein
VKLQEVNIYVKLFLCWYLFVFLSTEILSFFNILSSIYILFASYGFIIFVVYFFRNKLLLPSKESISPKTNLVIITLLILTFVQGLLSAPSTTDAMTYHIPRVLHWLQEQTIYQSTIRNSHDFMPPFAEYLLVHLYSFTGDDRLLFLSQWLAYAMSIYLSGVIALQLGADKKTKELTRLFVAVIPMAILQSTSTQVDMVSANLVLIVLHIVLVFLQMPNYTLAFYMALAIGLGLQIKAPFALSALMALVPLITSLAKQFKKVMLMGVFIASVVLLMQIRFFIQNISLYGNILGQNLSGSANTYANERFDLPAVASNVARNTFNHIPVPIFTNYADKSLVSFHSFLGINIHDPKTTYLNHDFHISPVLYPQEDIIGNPIHLIVIVIGGLMLFKVDIKNKYQLKVLYLGLLAYYLIFAFILKWEPYHNRLQIAFFLIGTITSVCLLSINKYGKNFLNTCLFLSIPLAFIIILLNVSRPYVSYGLFYENIKQFSLPLSSLPESFLIKPRDMQYFNARYYWYDPYNEISEILAGDKGLKAINFKLMDEFEYPFWVQLKEKGVRFRVVQENNLSEDTLIITTSNNPIQIISHQTQCFKTSVSYGFACISKRLKSL